MFLGFYTLFRSPNLALQVLAALPTAHRRGGGARVTRQSLTIASMVGFISLSGIAAQRHLAHHHYLHLVSMKAKFTPKMVKRAGKERLAPMLMTALTAGIVCSLVLAADEPGKRSFIRSPRSSWAD